MATVYNTEYTYRPDILIFDRLFNLRVPNIYAIQESNGYMTVVENDELDKQHMLKHVVVMWNIADIAEHQAKGRPFNLITRDDIQGIYTLIQQYLEVWVVETERELINKTIGPYEDLLTLDNLAKYLFDEYKLYLGQGLIHTKSEELITAQDALDAIFFRKTIKDRGDLEYDLKYHRYFTKRLQATNNEVRGDKNELRRKSTTK